MTNRQRETSRLMGVHAALRQVNQAIVWSSTRDELFDKICRALVGVGGIRIAWIGCLDPASGRLEPVAQSGDAGGLLAQIRDFADNRLEDSGPSGQAFRSGRSCIVDDTVSDPAMQPWRLMLEANGCPASAAFPIRMNGRVCGTLNVYAEIPGFLHDTETVLLEGAAADVSFALDKFARDAARRDSDEALDAERRFREAMFESMPGVLYFYDVAGSFVRWNSNFPAVSGYSDEEIARMHPRDFFAPGDRLRVERAIAEAVSSGESSIEASFLAKNGIETPYLFTGRRLAFKERTYLLGVGIDLSRQHFLSRELEKERTRLVAAQAVAKVGSWETDVHSGVVTWSDETYRIFEVDPATFQPTHEAFLMLVHPDDRQLVADAFAQSADLHEPYVLEHRLAMPDGRVKVVEERWQRFQAEGSPAVAIGTCHDVTERKRAETRLRESHDTLERTVAARTADLQIALARAEAADRIKSSFLATMSHELRTPLNSIIGFTGILLQELPGPLNAEQHKQLTMVRASSRHLLALVNDVLDISKIEAGQLAVSHQPFDVPRSIGTVVSLVTPQAEAKQLTLRVDIAPSLGEAVGDARRFEQILVNLLSNAVKFTERGEITLAADVVADVRFGESTTGVPAMRVQVDDTGIGIRGEDLSTLFQPFRQVASGLSRRHEGTGLGLAISRRLAGLLGGEIRAESQVGKGSRFVVTLPLSGRAEP